MTLAKLIVSFLLTVLLPYMAVDTAYESSTPRREKVSTTVVKLLLLCVCITFTLTLFLYCDYIALVPNVPIEPPKDTSTRWQRVKKVFA